MASAAFSPHGTLLKRGDGAATEVFAEIAELTTIGAIGGEKSPIAANHHGSNVEEWAPATMEKLGTLEISGNFIGSDAQQNGLDADYTSGVKRNFELVLTDVGNTVMSGAAIVTAFKIGSFDAGENVLTFTATLQVTTKFV